MDEQILIEEEIVAEPRRWGRGRWVLLVLVILVLVGLGTGLGLLISGRSSSAGLSKYSAVYMTSGDVYFGELSWFPKPHINNTYILQRGVDQNNAPQVAVAPFKSVVWGPGSIIYLNSKESVFWTRLRQDSSVARLIDNPSSAQQVVPPAQSQ